MGKEVNEQELRATIALLTEKVSRLNDEANQARRRVHDLQYSQPQLRPDVPLDRQKKARAEFAAKQAEWQAQLEKAEGDQAKAEAELAKVQPELTAAQAKIDKLDKSASVARQQRIEKIFTDAVTASPMKQAVEDAVAKMQVLRSKLTAAERELHGLDTTPPTLQDLAGERAKLLLDGGELEPDREPEDVSKRRRDLGRDIRTLTQAIKIQDGRVDQARIAYAQDLVRRILPACEAIVQMQFQGYSQAREAAIQARDLRALFAAETLSDYTLGNFSYPRIETPFGQAGDGWDGWVATMRRSGFRV